MIVVLHRERSEKLALRFIESLQHQVGEPFTPPPAGDPDFEKAVRAFDSLIQDGLISPVQHRAEGRE